MELQRVINKILNRSAIGDWRKDSLTGVWPRGEFAGKQYVRLHLLENGTHGYHVPQYWSWPGGARRITHYRWNNVTISMLEYSDQAELPTIVEMMM